MPLPGTHVVHPAWSAHHRPVADGTHTSEGTIRRPQGEGTLEPDGTWTPPPTTDIHTGPQRVQPATPDERVFVVGENRVTVRRYQVTLAADAPDIHVGDLDDITAANDPRLVGLKLRVTDVRYASETFERVLVCEERVEGEA